MREVLPLLVELIIFIFMCFAYWYLFGKIETSKRAKIAEMISLYGTLFIYGLAKNVKLSLLIATIFLIGIIKKITAKNERRIKGHSH